MESEPLVSVIMPTHNREQSVGAAVASVRAQTYARWELLVADDGSTDRTIPLVTGFQDSRIRVLPGPHAGLAAVPRNRALAETHGVYVAFLDSDDVWTARKLERQLAAMRQAPHARWSYTLFDHIDDAGAFLPAVAGGPWTALDGWVLTPLLTGAILPMIQTVLAETSFVRELGGFDERPDFREDLDLCARMADASEVVAVDAVLGRIRHHPHRTTFGRPDVRRWKARTFDKLAGTLRDPAARRLCRDLAATELRAFSRGAASRREWRRAIGTAAAACGRRPRDIRSWTTLLGVGARLITPEPVRGLWRGLRHGSGATQPGPGYAQESMPSAESEIARRRKASDRSGRLSLLWPDVPFSDRWAAHHRVRAAVAAVLNGRVPHDLDDGGNPRAMGIAAFLAGVGPLLGLWCDRHLITTTPALHAVLRDHLAHGRARAARRYETWAKVHAQLRLRGLDVVTLKGVHTGAVHFPESGARPANDVDLLVAPEQLPRAHAELVRAGLVPVPDSAVETRSEWEWAGASGSPRSLEMAHADDAHRLDLHVSLRRRGVAGRLVGPAVSGPADTDGCAALGPEARVLRQPLLTAYLAFHAGAHFPSIPLIRLIELVLVTRRDAPDWDTVLDRLASSGALSYAYPTLTYAEQLAPGTVPAAATHALQRSASSYLSHLVARTDPGHALHTSTGAWRAVLAFAEGPRDVLVTVGERLLRPSMRGWRDVVRIYRRRVARLVRPDAA